MKALIKEAGSVRLVDVPCPELRRADDVLVQVLVAGICRTDLYVASGAIPSAEPITLGHEFAGRVVACGGAAVRPDPPGAAVAIRPGDLVSADPRTADGFLGVDRHGVFAEYVLLPAANLYAFPETIEPRTAAYVEPIAAALAAPSLVDVERHARFPSGIDLPKWRGLVLGTSRFAHLVRDVIRSEALDVELADHAAPDSFDFAIETSGTASELERLIDSLEPGGLLVLKSRRPGSVEVPLHRIVTKGLTIRAQQYGKFEVAVDLVADGQIDVSDLLGESVPLVQYREAFARAAEDESRKSFLSCAE